MKYLCTLLVAILVSVQVSAQTNPKNGNSESRKTAEQLKKKVQTQGSKLDDDARKAALDVCDCINGYLSELHPAMIAYIRVIADGNEAKAQEDLTNYLTTHPEEAQRILEDANKMQQAEQSIDQRCGAIKERYKQYDDNKEFEEKMQNYLKNLPDCKLTYALIMKGQQNDD